MGTMGSILNRFDNLPIMEFMLFITMTVAICLLAYAQFKRDQLDLRWLILDDKTAKPSIHKIGQGLALLVSTWGFIKLILNDKFTTDYLLVYMGVWAGSTALNKLLDGRTASIQSTQITTVTSDQNTTVAATETESTVRQ